MSKGKAKKNGVGEKGKSRHRRGEEKKKEDGKNFPITTVNTPLQKK